MADIPFDKLKENLEIQLLELASLESVYCNPGEIKVEDIHTLEDMREFIGGKTNIRPQYLDLTVNLIVDDLKFELCFTLPHKYPDIEPEMFIRNHTLNRSTHVQLNKDLTEYILSVEKGEPCIFTAISWLQDHAKHYIEIKEETNTKRVAEEEKYVRYWIYSHHIYSKTKRREIVDLANRLHIGGFCMPGKPGIICVEGTIFSCNEWWQSIKAMTWKRIFLKLEENDQEQIGREFLKFDNFEEVVFTNSGLKFNHMDMGELYVYMEKHSLAYIFKDLFGIDGKSAS